jgi:type I restriction enzyme M protein
MMTELLDPKYGERICDPACGTAGFLVAAYEHILRENTSRDLAKAGNLAGDRLNSSQWSILREESLYGYDFDQTMVRISLMNLMMHGITDPNIDQKNTLSKRFSESNLYDAVMANPPFKGSIDESEIGENFRTKTKKTELLFLELMFNLLTNGGRCTVIVPDGVLFGNSKAHRKIREMLIDRCRLDAVISMPSGVFKPYAGVSTAILFFTKGEPTKQVWFYDMENDGFSLDDKRVPIDRNDIPDIIKQFENRQEKQHNDRKKKHFLVQASEIKANGYDLNISKYREIRYEEVKYEKPDVIKNRILELEQEIVRTLEGTDVG